MKVIVNEIEYNVRQLSIDDYEYLTNNPNLDDISLIELLTGAKKKEIIKAPFSQVKFIAGVLKTQLGEEGSGTLDLVIKFKDKNYGLIKPSEITWEEWVNLEVFFAEKPLNLKRLATHLYKPLKSDKIGEERELIDYSLDECMSREKEFGEFPIQSTITALFFLETFGQEYIKTILSSMETKMTEKKKKEEKKKPLIIHKK